MSETVFPTIAMPDEGDGAVAKPAQDTPIFDMPGDDPAIAILVGLLLPAVQAARDENPEMPSTPTIPPVEKVIDQPTESEREAASATGFSDFDLSAGETFEAVDQFSFNFAEIKHRSHAAEAADPEDIDLFAPGFIEMSEQIEFNYIEIKGSSPAPQETDPDELLLAPGRDQDPALDQMIADAARTYGDKDKPNDLLIGGDGADVLSDNPWFDPVDDVLV